MPRALFRVSPFYPWFQQMGYIAAYYLLGCVFKKHGDFRLFKLCLVTIIPVSMISYLLPGALASHAPDLLPLVATAISGTLFMLFILMSPAYAKHLFHAEWSENFYAIDMFASTRQMGVSALLDKQNLTRGKGYGGTAERKAAKRCLFEISIHTATTISKTLQKQHQPPELLAHPVPCRTGDVIPPDRIKSPH